MTERMDFTGKTYETEVGPYIRSLPLEQQMAEIHRWAVHDRAVRGPALAAKVRERLNHPTPDRITEILRRGKLPKRTLPGLRSLEQLPANEAGFAAAAQYYADWANKKLPGSGRGLYFHGTAGTGKTTVLTALAFDLLHRGGRHSITGPEWTGPALVHDFEPPSVQFWKLNVLLEKLKPKRGRDEEEDDFRIDDIQECDVLVIDDLGKVRPTDWNMLTLFSVLDVRDSELRPTWYSSNYSKEELEVRYLAALGTKYAADIDALIDRIAGNCEQVEFCGPSWRLG